jgi:hypothetical protein
VASCFYRGNDLVPMVLDTLIIIDTDWYVY